MPQQNTLQEDPRARSYRASPSSDGCAVGVASERRLPADHLHFGQALDVLRCGGRVARTGWNGRNQFIQLQVPDKESKMSRPYIFISATNGDLVPSVASQSDLLAFDWCLVTERTVLQYGDEPTLGVRGA